MTNTLAVLFLLAIGAATQAVGATKSPACVQGPGYPTSRRVVMPPRTPNNVSARRETAKSIRDFLWHSWSSHVPACTVVEDTTIEGDEVTSSYFIQRDSSGEWTVRVIRVNADGGLPSAGSHPRPVRSDFTAYAVDRVAIRHRGSARREFILVFRDKAGKELSTK
jgi:hypothetical protein